MEFLHRGPRKKILHFHPKRKYIFFIGYFCLFLAIWTMGLNLDSTEVRIRIRIQLIWIHSTSKDSSFRCLLWSLVKHILHFHQKRKFFFHQLFFLFLAMGALGLNLDSSEAWIQIRIKLIWIHSTGKGLQLSLPTLKSSKVLCEPWGLFLHAYALHFTRLPFFLEHIEKLSLSTTQEVSLASLKSFHEMVVAGEENTDKQDQARYRTSISLLSLMVSQNTCFFSYAGFQDTRQ